MIRTLAAAALMAVAVSANAQPYPARPVSLVVPFAAGGPSDVHMRNLAVAMGRQLKQTVLVENVPGGGSNIGPARVAKAAPDGYTLLNHNLGLATAPTLYGKLEYNALTDFDYIGVIVFESSVVIARGDLPAAGFKEFLGYLKANQNKLTIGDGGGPSTLSALLLMAATGTRLTLVQYKGTAQAMNDLIAGHIDLLSNAATIAAPHIRAGKVKAIGVTGRSRVSTLPDVPTMEEQGLSGFEMVVFQALYAPKGLPKPVHERLVAALQGALADPQLVAYFQKVGAQIATREQATPAALQALLKSEMDKWGPMLKRAGVTAK